MLEQNSELESGRREFHFVDSSAILFVTSLDQFVLTYIERERRERDKQRERRERYK